MSIVNRRNAVLGWTTWQVTKHLAKAGRRGRRCLGRGAGPNKPAIAAAGAAALAGSVLLAQGASAPRPLKAKAKAKAAAEAETPSNRPGSCS
jgi:hypothetical protein